MPPHPDRRKTAIRQRKGGYDLSLDTGGFWLAPCASTILPPHNMNGDLRFFLAVIGPEKGGDSSIGKLGDPLVPKEKAQRGIMRDDDRRFPGQPVIIRTHDARFVFPRIGILIRFIGFEALKKPVILEPQNGSRDGRLNFRRGIRFANKFELIQSVATSRRVKMDGDQSFSFGIENRQRRIGPVQPAKREKKIAIRALGHSARPKLGCGPIDWPLPVFPAFPPRFAVVAARSDSEFAVGVFLVRAQASDQHQGLIIQLGENGKATVLFGCGQGGAIGNPGLTQNFHGCVTSRYLTEDRVW